MASVIIVNKNSSREVPLSQTVTVVGRDGGVGLELGDLQVSRRHALLVCAATGYFVKDLGSRNGVLLNKQRLPSRTQANLKNGDVLSLGRTTLIFKDLGGGAEDDRTPTPEHVETVQRAVPISDPPAAEQDDELELVPEEEPERPTPKRPRRRATSSRHDAIPRAAAPAPVYSGQAEVLTLRALVERSERDRVYYRNLALILFVLLIVTLVLVFAWALTQGRERESSSAPLPTNAPAPTVAAALDASVFAATVHPILSEHCAACHEHVGRGGNLVIAQGNDPATLEANLASAARFVRAGDPEGSALLLKAVGPEDGGSPHDGGAVLTVSSPEWLAIRAWVRGVAPTPATRGPAPRDEPNAPPTARIAGVELSTVGDGVELSGKASVDPQGDELTFRWTLIESPAGATAALQDAAASTVRFAPDVPGRYTVALVVRDPLAATGSAEHVLRVEPAPRDLTREAGLGRAWESLLGRTPTANELEGLHALDGSELRKFFLDRDELYRRWWDAELYHLGLSGRHAPQGDPWDTFPARLKSGKYTVQNAYYALLVGQAWTARYEGRDAYVGAVLEKVLGPERRQDPALREAGNRLFDGHESTLLGKRTKGQVGLVRVATRHPAAVRYLLWRNHRSLFNREPPQDLLDAATARLVERPTELFAILVDWACKGL